MDLHFVEPDEVPVPPDEVELRRIELSPHPDGRRIAVRLDLTPFLEPPSIDVEVLAPSGDKAAETSIIETVDHQLEFTIHLRSPAASGEYRCKVTVGYQDQPPVDAKEVSFRLVDA